MDTQQTTNPQLASIGASLARSIDRHIVQNDAVSAAFAELAFEITLANGMQDSVNVADLLEQTA